MKNPLKMSCFSQSFLTIINIVNALVGVSIFAMPWGFGRAGLIGGFTVLVFVAYLSFDTAKILLKTQRILFFKTGNVYGFPEICSQILGNPKLSH